MNDFCSPSAAKMPAGVPLPCGRKGPAAGVALVITLSVVVLLTIIVVSFATTMQLERASSRSSFEQKRAQSLSMLAVDEVIGKLRDNIPTDGQWAVGPGKLYATKTPTGTTPVTVDLSSGNASSASTGSVALNRPSLSVPTNYPIVPLNADYATPDPMLVNWINVLQDGTRSTDTDYSSKLNLTTNPIVGRYAYWTDVETGKADLNTAGYAATGATQIYYDTQLYQSQPNRVDLTQLDSGTPITRQSSLDTFVYNSGAQKASGSTTRYNPPYVPSATAVPSRYNAVEEWVRTPSALNSGILSGITAAQVAANRFYLTTQARAPELNPWGLNKVWWTNYPPGNPLASPTGNFANSPKYAPAVGISGHPWCPDPRYNYSNTDNRYYVYPWAARDWSNWSATESSSSGNPARPFQNFAGFTGNVYPSPNQYDSSFNAFFLSLYQQLARRDWPGMPAVSFVDKYGQAACENIVTNIMAMADSTIGSQDGMTQKMQNNKRASIYGGTPAQYPLCRDIGGIYGLYLWDSPLGSGRKLWGQGCWPMVNEVIVDFAPTVNAKVKSASQPGFAAAATGNAINVLITPRVEFIWPPGMSTYRVSSAHVNLERFGVQGSDTGIVTALTEIVVQATGTLNGNTVSYDGVANPSLYAWRFGDDTPTGNAAGYTLSGITMSAPTGATPTYKASPLTNSRNFVVGPFDKGSSPDVKVSFRIGTRVLGYWENNVSLQVIPTVAASATGATDTTQKFTYEYNPASLTASSPDVSQSWECIDPRVYQDISDWIYNPSGNTIEAQNSIYTSTNANDPTLDDSKLTWPPIEFVSDQAANYQPPQFVASGTTQPPNSYQTATSITGMPGLGWLSLISTADYSKGARSEAWKTLKFEPATQSGQLPDWLMMEIFAMAYDSSYCSQTAGKLNLNGQVNPFNFYRTRPLQALIGTVTSDGGTVTNAATLAQNIAKRTFSGGAATFNSSPVYLYPGEICQVAGMADDTSKKQFAREALVRDIGGLATTQSSDFLVHVAAQSVKQVSNTGNPTSDLKMLSEYRGDAYVERTPDVGPDGIPGTADDLDGPDGQKGTDDDLTLVSVSGGTITSSMLNYNVSTDPLLEAGAGRPPIHYRLTSFRPLTQ